MSDPNPEPTKRSTGVQRLLLAFVLSPVIFVGGCTMLFMFPWKSIAPASSTQPDSASKYTQTWAKQYKLTSCGEWKRGMSEHERWAASADMLTAARNKISGGKGLPSDAMVTLFEQNISTACEATDGENIAEIAVFVYQYDNTFKP